MVRAPHQGVDYRFIRDINRAQVLNCIRLSGPLSRAAIARQTRLSRTSVGTIVDVLLGEDLVREGPALSPPSAEVGRPGTLVALHADARMVLGVDIGRSHLTLLLTNLAAEERGIRSFPFTTAAGPVESLTRAIPTMHTFLADHQVAWDHLLGIGLSLPGPLDRTRRHLVNPPRMPGWDGVDLPTLLTPLLPSPVPLLIDKDTNLGALAEYRYGAGRGSDELAYVKVGTGIGSSLLSHGQMQRGHAGSAGEIGHIVVARHGVRCVCGQAGCLETMAGAEAIVAFAGRVGADIAEVIALARAGDHPSQAAIQMAGTAIGQVLAALVNIANPALILLTGSVSGADDLLLAPIQTALRAESVRAATRDLRVQRSPLADRAMALGAVSSVLDAMFATPTDLPTPPVPRP